MGKRELTPSEWLRILTNNQIDASDIALCEGCTIKTARQIVLGLTGQHKRGTPYVCRLDDYLLKHKHTTKRAELRAIYGE